MCVENMMQYDSEGGDSEPERAADLPQQMQQVWGSMKYTGFYERGASQKDKPSYRKDAVQQRKKDKERAVELHKKKAAKKRKLKEKLKMAGTAAEKKQKSGEGDSAEEGEGQPDEDGDKDDEDDDDEEEDLELANEPITSKAKKKKQKKASSKLPRELHVTVPLGSSRVELLEAVEEFRPLSVLFQRFISKGGHYGLVKFKTHSAAQKAKAA